MTGRIHSYGQRSVIVVLGAAVGPGGRPSEPMSRRVEAALNAAARLDDPFFMPSGGLGKNGPSEAVVMRSLLETAGVKGDRIICEDRAKSTLASVVNCASILRSRFQDARVLVCTDLYHQPRAAWLFRLAGIYVETRPLPGGFSAIYLRRWLYYIVRELFAIPVDTVLLMAHRWLGMTVRVMTLGLIAWKV